MLALLRKYLRFFLMTACAAVALRLLFVFGSPHISDDSFIYGDIAKNWLRHGIYGLTGAGEVYPTYIRLPGYPAFLAVVFAIFGMEHYRAVLVVQMLFDIGTCFLIANSARRLFSERAAKIAFLLAAVCPFLANYCAAALSETLEIFFTALALDLAIAGLQKHKNLCWIGCGLACSGAIFLRPDGGLLPMAIGLYLLVLLVRNVLSKHSASIKKISTSQLIRVGIIFSVASLAPLIPWAARNWITMHRFQPLAPRYANEDDEYVDIGFNRWVKTWMVDYVSVEEIYWNVPGIKIDAKLLPSRAFDSSEQKQQTEQLIDQYNSTLDLDPQLDQKFNSLADARIHQRPLRYYVKLPFLRIADMWLRPRTELLPPDPRWWQFNDDRRWLTVALGFGLLNFAYVGLACLGAWRERSLPFLGLLLTFVILRSVFLGSLENPETRYTLECYPAVVLFIAALFRTS
ncbi:MAG TPA: glycosyltransferase family 39 protein [Terriglobales bacterium]